MADDFFIISYAAHSLVFGSCFFTAARKKYSISAIAVMTHEKINGRYSDSSVLKCANTV